MLIWFMNKIDLFFILVCCVQSYLLPFSCRLRLHFLLPFIKITARIDRPQTQRNWQRPGIEIHQSPHIHWPQFDYRVKRSGPLHWLLEAKWRTCNSLFGFELQTRPYSTLRKKEEKTKFWGRLVESVVFQKTVIKSTFDYGIEASWG